MNKLIWAHCCSCMFDTLAVSFKPMLVIMELANWYKTINGDCRQH